MLIAPGLSRLATALAIGGLLCSSALTPVARAQPAPPPGAAPPAGDPPSLVGRLAAVAGTVSFHTVDQTQWQPATLNYPVTSGDSFWTEPRASAAIEAGPMRIALNEQTEFDVDTLDQRTLAATSPQGEMFLLIRDLPQGDSVSVTTPRAAVTITMPGSYEIAAGDTDHPTIVTVVDGAAHVGGGALALDVGPHQTASITGTDAFQGGIGPEQDDAFLRGQLDLARPRPVQAAYQPPPEVLAMTGADVLETTGQWAPTPEYGEVWYPPVDPGWVPYRHGHWAYVQPWGWTWVDDAAWGFAPSHYGRWVEIDNRWGWTPVLPGAPRFDRPVYAPALVSFVDVAGGVAVGAAVGLGVAAAVGWIPLGPREPYFPPYRASDGYVRNVNAGNVTNITNIENIRNQNRSFNTFVNRGAATVVPGAAMAASQPIASRVERVSPQALAAARPAWQPSVRPTAATMGITPAVARTMNLPPAPPGTAPRPVAPGPAVQPRGPGGAARGDPVDRLTRRRASGRAAAAGDPGRAAAHAARRGARPSDRPARTRGAPGRPPDGAAPPRGRSVRRAASGGHDPGGATSDHAHAATGPRAATPHRGSARAGTAPSRRSAGRARAAATRASSARAGAAAPRAGPAGTRAAASSGNSAGAGTAAPGGGTTRAGAAARGRATASGRAPGAHARRKKAELAAREIRAAVRRRSCDARRRRLPTGDTAFR